MRVLVCGGRDYENYAELSRTLNSRTAPIDCIIHGCATGADELASQWARLHGVSEWRFTANWKAHGKAAGPIRNSAMLSVGRPHLVIACPGGRGTADMVRKARGVFIPVVELEK